MTDKKLSRQINIKGMPIGEVMKLFKGNEFVTSKITDLIEAIDTPDESAPMSLIGSVKARTLRNGSTVYDTQFYAGFKGGKQVGRKVTGKTPEESQRRALELTAQVKAGSIPTSKRLLHSTVSQWINSWLDEILELSLVTAMTHSSYKKKMDSYIINPKGANAGLHKIGDIKLAQLSVDDVHALYTSMLGRGLSRRTIQHVKSVMTNSFNYAITKDLLKHNVAYTSKAPRIKKKKEQVFLMHQELSNLLDACEDSPIGDFVVLVGLTGMRKSEARSLRWKDIDSISGDIHVRKAMRYVNHVGMVDGETKNEWSVRKIELAPDNFLFGMLASRRAIRSAELLMVETKVQDNDLLFCYGNGKPWGDRYISNHFKKIVEKAGITKKIGLRNLRHTYATLNLEHDELHNVSRTLGHKHISTTHDIYGHVIAGSGRKASKRFTETLKQHSA